jgi:NAD(P)-dependent dehydrogenase (short-subunit alcohol dehydrogenase family)
MAPVALLTGASRGIGRAIALALVGAGWRVWGAARAPVPVPGVEMRACDVADAAAVATWVGDAIAAEGRIDALVNNAGIAGSNRLAAADDALWRAILATNLTGTYLCSRAAIPHLPDGSGRIVNIASILGLRGAADQSAYTAAKHGVVGLTRALALALGPRGITVNALCPGWVATDMAAARYRALGITEREAAAMAPLARVASPEDIAAAVLFLLSPAARHITGQAIPIDGGASA